MKYLIKYKFEINVKGSDNKSLPREYQGRQMDTLPDL